MSKIIGIDLGTTNSLVTVWEDGKAVCIPNAYGDFLTPSVVSFEGEEVIVGKAAKERLITAPDDTIASFKRNMGRKTLLKNKFTAAELSSFILKNLKADAERYLKEEVSEAVISVPAYFDDKARKATKLAGELAGLTVNRIINEPSAAALGYLKNTEKGRELSGDFDNHKLLVFDFGGGTLDVSLLETFENVVEIISVSGDNMLGGIDFDKAIAINYIKSLDKDPAQIKPQDFNIILEDAEALKRKLSEKKEASVKVNAKGYKGIMSLTMKEFAALSAPIFKKIYVPIQNVLRDSGNKPEDIDEVIVVGGSGKMPIVQQYLKHILKKDKLYVYDPDKIVALGMGVYAGIKERDEDVKDVILTDVAPFSLGISTVNYTNPEKPLSSFIIPRNTALPASRTHPYTVLYDGQGIIKVDIFQGEEMYAEENRQIGSFEVNLHGLGKEGMLTYITFTYDLNGFLIVNVDIPDLEMTQEELFVDNELGLDEETVKTKVEQLKGLKLVSYEDEENLRIIEWGKKLFVQCPDNIKREISKKILFFESKLAEDRYEAIKLRKYLKMYFLNIEMTILKNLLENYEYDDSWLDEETRETDESFKRWEEDHKNDEE